MFCLFTHQAKIQICCTVKLISWNIVNLSHLYSYKLFFKHCGALEILDFLKLKALTSLLISRTLIRNFFRKGRVTFKMLFCHGGISASCIPHTFKAISSEFLFATSTCKLNICIILNYIKDLSKNGRNSLTVCSSFS